MVITTAQVSEQVIEGMWGGQRAEEGCTPHLLLSPSKPSRGSSAPSSSGTEPGLPVPAEVSSLLPSLFLTQTGSPWWEAMPVTGLSQA